MYSSRLDWNVQPNPIAALLEEKRRAGVALLDLTESNPPAARIEYPAGAIAAALAGGGALRYDPTPAGLPSAREAVASYYAERGVTVDPARVLLTASTSEAYAYLFKLLCDPGDEVLTPRPSYPLFEYLARLESVNVRQYPLFYDHGWHIDAAALRSLIDPRTRAIVLVNPNNPTGSYLKRGEIAELSAICAGHDLALISDEVFSDYSLRDDPDRASTVIGAERSFALSGLSKIAGLPQMKLGWMVVSEASAFERLELIADTYLSVGTPVQLALPALLAARAGVQRQITARTLANMAFLRGQDLRVLDVEGGWYATVQVPRVRSEQEWVLELLGRHDVLVQPGFFYDFEREAFLVLSLLTPSDVFEEGVRRIVRCCSS
jgi:aspartate/methionine/tyrosine aminotransferase